MTTTQLVRHTMRNCPMSEYLACRAYLAATSDAGRRAALTRLELLGAVSVGRPLD